MLLRVVGELSSWSFENDPLNLTDPRVLTLGARGIFFLWRREITRPSRGQEA